MKSLLSASCLAVLLLAASSTDALRADVKSGVASSKKVQHQSHTLAMRKKAPVFIPTKDGSHGSRLGMGWKDAGSTIPMSGGVISMGSFYTDITVGTAGKNGEGVTFNTIVDTGSSNTAVPGANCVNCGTTHFYNASESPTSQKLMCTDPMAKNCIPTRVGSAAVPSGSPGDCLFGQPTCDANGQSTFSISYGGSGTATHGTTVLEYVCLGSICSNEVYINQFTNQYPAGTQPSGILGLAFPHNSCTPNCQPTILDVMADKGVIAPEDNGFGMCLTPDKGGFIDLGMLNSSRYTAGTMQYTKVIKEHWYNIEVKDMHINGTTIGCPSFLYSIVNDGIGGFADSGTTVVLVSPYAMQLITSIMTSSMWSHLKGVQTLFADSQCVSLTDEEVLAYPMMHFVVAGMNGMADFTVKMTAEQYLMNVGGGTRCLGIAGVPSIGVIFGDVIMQNYYIHFDRHGGRLGFAELKDGSCNAF